MTGGGTEKRLATPTLEKALRELERLLKADQQTGASGNGAPAAADPAITARALRSVLRKLMEAYFTPLNGALTLYADSFACLCIAPRRRDARAPHERCRRVRRIKGAQCAWKNAKN